MNEDAPGLLVDVLGHPVCLAWPRRRTADRSWHPHIPFAMFLVDVLRPSVLVDLGVGAGDAYCAFCQAVTGTRLDARCYGVDAWDDPEVLEDLRAHHDRRYGDVSTLLRVSFDEALPRFADGSIGLLHIDGTRADARALFEAWLPKVRGGGVVLVHGVGPRGRHPETARFWREVITRHPHLEFHHGEGLGLLAVGEVRASELAALLAANHADAENVRGLFAQLGQRLALQDDLDAVERRLADARSELARARSLVAAGPAAEANLLQLFWDDGGRFSEACSVSVPLVTDDQIHQYVLPVPAAARGPWRLDVGNRPAYVEIHGLELVAGGPLERDGRVVARWSATPARGVDRLAEHGTYGFICWDGDPQLALTPSGEDEGAGPRHLRVTLRASEHVLDVVRRVVGRLERRHARLRRRLREGETALAAAQVRLAERERLAEALAERARAQERVLTVSRSRWRSARRRLAEHHAERERARQAHAVELAEARHRLAGLPALESLRADLERRGRELAESARRLEAREYELYRITSSRGWRLLNRYRELKRRVPRFLWTLGNLARRVMRREYRPRLEPLQELRWLHDRGAWEATGRDPQFNLAPPWPRGWVEVALHIVPDGAVVGQARLYVDRGEGFTERESHELGEAGVRHIRHVWLDRDVIALRLDPFESPGRFGDPAFTLARVSARRAREAQAAARARPRAPRPSEHVTGRADAPAPLAPAGDAVHPYEAWLDVNRWNARRAAILAGRLAALTEPPRLSVVMPVYNPAPEFLEAAIGSVAAQAYERWELCLVDDASTDPAVSETLRRWADRDPRIRVIARETNGGVSRATNSGVEAARGEFVAFLDQDDELAPDALGEIALHLGAHPDTDLVYSDDDKINAQGRRFAPQFKPDWSPELLLSCMYLSHLLVVRRRLVLAAGGLRPGYEGSQDYDLALRVTELTDRVGHVPKVLYHWRAWAGSTAASADAKPESIAVGLRAVQDALDRRGIRAVAQHPEWAVRARCGMFAHEFADDGPRVAIIIPTKNNLAMLEACLESLGRTTYKNYQIVIVDNGGDDAAALAVLRDTGCTVLRIESPGGRFSFAALNNRAVDQVDAELVLFLNDDTEIVAPRWLSQMVGYLGLPGVGAVGARLRFPDGRLQHAGVVLGYYHGLAGPAFKLLPASALGYLSHAMLARNYSAVTAACLLTRRDLFRRLGGFDETRFAVAYNDVDYCGRLRADGHRVVYCPTAELIHHEGASRGFTDDPAEPAEFRRAAGSRRDPFYNPNLSLRDERFVVDARTLAPASLPPIRTLMCAFNLNWEGAPYSQLELTVALKDAGVIDPIVHSLHDGPLRAAYEAHGIRVEVTDHPMRGVHTAPDYEAAIGRLAAWVAGLGVELVYGNTRQTFYGIDAARRLGLPSVWNPRESEPWQTYFDFLGAEIAPLALRCFAYPYKVVFVADASRESCAALETRHNFVTVHTGLDRARFTAALARWPREAARAALGLASGDVMALSLGTVCERKGQLDLVEAVARLDRATAERLRVFVVGERPGEYNDRVRAAREALPADRRARLALVPETQDVAVYYAAADLFVLTSRVESFPRVNLEAMAAGLPIVTTPVNGVVEQVQENVNALWFSPGDTDTLARHLTRLVLEPALRRKLAANSRHVLEIRNDFDTMVGAYGEIFREAWLTGTPR
jgi:GT2 family glycosyltransferase